MASLDPAAAAEIDAVYAAFAERVEAPGVVAGVVKDGGLAHLFTHGVSDLATGAPVTADTCFRIASMTKQVTATAILMLRDEGRLSLEASALTYVPELADLPPPTADSPPITVRDLLSHTEGFVTDDPWADRAMRMTPDDFTAFLRDGGLFAQAPGVAFEYSNLGYGILGRIISNLCGRPFQQVIGERLLRPLGMDATRFDPDAVPDGQRARGYWRRGGAYGEEPPEPDGEIAAMGGIITPAKDYARWVAFLLDAWPPRDEAETGPVRRATRRELAVSHAMPGPARTRTAGGETLPVAIAYGYGLASTHDPQLGRCLAHSGGLPGFGSNMFFSPDAGIGLFAFANVTYAGPEAANVEAAGVLQAHGLWRARPVAVSPALQAAADAVAQAFAAGRLDAIQAWFAPNLLADLPLESRNRALSELKSRLGDSRLTRIEARHALAGRLHFAGERGEAACELALTPGADPKIQVLRFDPA
ncbi:serine hydrolase domain-containing protein [Phenylobacterium sp.]|uniref:serine hydrolase domain-containing protein n=1 Tax=Phenylobacterium sp. TaxID=1871053 RepID=UPI002BDBCDD7|nr:serine hydrolase domain-containing protein [Phenylobacterium sp.]HLZ74573.1 serine hydrolase domain-containing protein [Phenylobacterium sp.]